MAHDADLVGLVAAGQGRPDPPRAPGRAVFGPPESIGDAAITLDQAAALMANTSTSETGNSNLMSIRASRGVRRTKRDIDERYTVDRPGSFI